MQKKKSYYFIGIKGSGMSALANVVKNLGHEVAGSDIDAYVFTERKLRENDIAIYSFAANNLAEKNYDVIVRGVVFTEENNPEVAYAKENGLHIVSYHEMLRDLSNHYTSIAVSGTHGKTTTTGMLAAAFSDEEIAYLIGDGTGSAHEDSKYFLFESCEYKRHFLWYTPDYQIITNIDFDHPDYFKDTDDVVTAFVQSAQQVKKAVVTFGDDIFVQQMIQELHDKVSVITFGENASNDYVIQNYTPTDAGISFDLIHNGISEHFAFPFYGKHMMLNAVSTLVVADLEHKDLQKTSANLSLFAGVDRRFNVEKIDDYIIVDDYAHHPNEIKVTIEAARQQFPDKELVAIFQPHTFSRTNALASDFADVLSLADTIYVTDIFTSAREMGNDVYPSVILEKLPDAKHLPFESFTMLKDHKNSVLIFMGAGNIQNYIKKFSISLKKV